MREVSFYSSPEEIELAQKIAKRAKTLLSADIMSTEMDVIATNANGCPLDMKKLLGFDDFNFAHDIGGIARHLDRTTGKLGDFFLPRCSA